MTPLFLFFNETPVYWWLHLYHLTPFGNKIQSSHWRLFFSVRPWYGALPIPTTTGPVHYHFKSVKDSLPGMYSYICCIWKRKYHSPGRGSIPNMEMGLLGSAHLINVPKPPSKHALLFKAHPADAMSQPGGESSWVSVHCHSLWWIPLCHLHALPHPNPAVKSCFNPPACSPLWYRKLRKDVIDAYLGHSDPTGGCGDN